jgi:DNA ligase D-like protein (predicted polymerase)
MWPGGRRSPFCADGWLFEVEHPGLRLLAYCEGLGVELEAQGQRVTERLPEVARTLAAMRLPGVVLDGVVGAPGDEGRELVRRRLRLADPAAVETERWRQPLTYYVFDLVHLGDHSLLKVPLVERRRLLGRFLPDRGPVQFVAHLPGEGEAACAEARRLRVRLVAKRAASPYQPGERSPDWLLVEPGQVPGPSAAPVPTLAEAAALAEQIRATRQRTIALHVGGQVVKLTNLDKVFWPPLLQRPALLKRDLLAYYAHMAPWLLPFLHDRPLTLRRYVDGVSGQSFYQRDWHEPAPEFVRMVTIYAPSAQRDVQAVVCDNAATLLWLANLADVELHAWYARCSNDGQPWPEEFAGRAEVVEESSLNYPDFVVFDLDPWIKAAPGSGEQERRAAFAACTAVAELLRERLQAWGLEAYVKWSGKSGLHVFVPVERRYRFEITREWARRLAAQLAADHPDLVTTQWRVGKRAGKVFIDHLQNARGKTLPAPYSLRATPEATVSMPLRWEELRAADLHEFTLLTVPELLQRAGDPWQGMLDRRGRLAPALQALGMA